MKVLFVCMGNICRSPMAEVVAREFCKQAGYSQFVFDSAGTHSHHAGERPDPRALAALVARKYVAGNLRSRRLIEQDFGKFDWIFAMDQSNLRDLRRVCPPELSAKVRLFLELAPELERLDMPDPYYGSAQGFEHVLDLCEAAAGGLLAALARGEVLGPAPQ